MNSTIRRFRVRRGSWRRPMAIFCVALIASGDSVFFGQQPASTTAESPKIPNDQLDSLVAPIALYPDPLLSQTLVASTYPLEIVQLQQWLQKNKNLKPKEIDQAVGKQDWDPSIQAMAVFPDVVKNMSENIKWTADLGNAFLAQQSDVMDAVQRMRSKAKDAGQLKSTQQQTVETKVVENKTVVVIEQSNPEVVYVPSYDPMVVWGAPAYPYPPVYYPGAYAAAGVISFGVGLAIGAAWGGGGWGWNSGWGGGNNNININNNNNHINHYNKTRANGSGNRVGSGNGQWKHNPEHRGGAPYGDRKTAQQFGGSARGDSAAARQSTARQNSGSRQSGAADRRAGGSGISDRGSAARTGGSGMGGDRVGNRQVSGGSGQRGSAFSGASSGMGGGAARSSSQRGASSMGRSGGGGGFRGGGGRRR